MFERILKFLERIFRKDSIPKALKEGREMQYSKGIEKKAFTSEIKFYNGEEGKKLIQEILDGKEDFSNPQEIKEKMLKYIDVLIKQVGKCQNDITISKLELKNIKNKLI